MRPAEEWATGGLHPPLPVDHPLPAVGVLAFGEVSLEHRPLGLLDLEHERVGVVSADKQPDPGPGADAADADDLAGDVHEPVLVEQIASLSCQGRPVHLHHAPDLVRDRAPPLVSDEFLDRDDQRRVADKPPLALDDAGEFGRGPHVVFRAGLGDVCLDVCEPAGAELAAQPPHHALDLEV